jgi:hypothetical protein
MQEIAAATPIEKEGFSGRTEETQKMFYQISFGLSGAQPVSLFGIKHHQTTRPLAPGST